MMKNRTAFFTLGMCVFLTACSYRGSITKVRTISRHYTLEHGHASTKSDDYGETEYITKINDGTISKANYCDFDSFYYYDNQHSSEAIYHKGFKDYVCIEEDKTYFNFHYDGRCEYKVTLIDDTTSFEEYGSYRFVSDDDILITFEDGRTEVARTRFGLYHKGIGNGKINFLQVPITININGELKLIYFWFYDTITHSSPWGER